jgi:UDP:flavonoid glycosyltransferase YjiC (YdhE family)
MRVLITTNRGAGHVGPILPFAHAFRRAGDEVLIAAPVSARALVLGAGMSLHALPDPPQDEIATAMAPFPWLSHDEQGRRMMRDVFAGIHARASLPRTLRAAADYDPDIVLSEPTEFAGRLAAERFGLPFARIGIMAAATEDWAGPIVAPALAEHRARLGIRHVLDGRSPYLTVFPEPLEEPGTAVDALHFREPAADPWPLPDWWGGDERPLVYATYGSVVPGLPTFPEIFRATVDALGELPVRVLFTVGTEVDLDRLGPAPANVRIERWVPQSRVMPYADAVIGHGGAGTTRLALTAGVPSVVSPSFADQPRNAARLAELGAGIALPEGVQGLDGLGDAVMRVLTDPAYRAAAGWAAARIATAPLVDEAPALLRDRLALARAA